MELTFTEKNGYLLAQVIGDYHFDEMTQLVPRIRDECVQRGFNRLLVDIVQMVGSVPNLDRFLLAEQTATASGGKLQIAIVARPEEITDFFENVAVNRAANLKVFPDEQAALTWLLP